VKLVWSKTALKDLRELGSYIGQDNLDAALHVEARVHDTARLIANFPKAGRIGRVAGTREIVIRNTPYILAYKIVRNKIRILRAFHGARRWPLRFD
jgi:toxin ParE1/3/4